MGEEGTQDFSFSVDVFGDVTERPADYVGRITVLSADILWFMLLPYSIHSERDAVDLLSSSTTISK